MAMVLVQFCVLLLAYATIGAEETQKSSTNFALRLVMFDHENGTTPWKFPHKIYIGRHAYLEIQVKWIKVENQVDQLNTFLITPQDCFFSTNSNPTAQEETHHIIQSGCIKPDAQVSFFPSATASKRRFSIFVASNYFPQRAFMFLHCKAMLCSVQNANGFFPHQRDNKSEVAGEMCPIDACQTPHFVPQEHARAFSVFTGPLQASFAPEVFGVADDAPPPSWTIDGQKMPQNLLQKEAPRCDTCPMDYDGQQNDDASLDSMPNCQKFIAANAQNSAGVMILFGIAGGSFLIGCCFAGCLCYVHHSTVDPNNGLKKHLQKSLSGNHHQQQRSLRTPSSLSADQGNQPTVGRNPILSPTAESTASTRISADVSTGAQMANGGGGRLKTSGGDDSVLLLGLGDERCC